MAEREARPKNRPEPDQTRRSAGVTTGECGLCGEPISDAAPGRLHIPNGPADREYYAHAKCISEKGMMRTAMRAPQLP